MRIILLEIKHLLKMRTTIIIAAIIILFSCLMPLAVISFEKYYYIDNSGAVAEISGFAALEANKKMYNGTSTIIDADAIKEAFEIYHSLIVKYGEENKIPKEIYYEKIQPIKHILTVVQYAFIDNSTGEIPPLKDISTEDALSYYSLRMDTLIKYVEKRNSGENIFEVSLAIIESNETPFVFVYGFRSNAFNYLAILIWIIVALCIFLAAPVFSSGYQSGADDILRCTKFGKKTLAIAKTISSLLVTIFLFFLGCFLFLLLLNSFYGWESIKTSSQMLWPLSIAPFTVGQEEILVVFSGLVGLISTICLSIFFSSISKSPSTAMALSYACLLLPDILRFTISNNLSWLLLFFPTSGIALTGSFYLHLEGCSFLSIGSLAVWTPYVLLAFPMIIAPIFVALAIFFYGKHRV